MQFPESWLREFCNPPLTTQELADTLTMAGLEVEELRPVAPPFTGIVVGEIKEAVQHPNADRLRVCQVDVGQGALLNIVCGAPNARVGIKVPCAWWAPSCRPATTASPSSSRWASCAAWRARACCARPRAQAVRRPRRPAGAGRRAPVGQDIRAHLNLDDTLFTLKLTPNLAHCLSVYGIARECLR
jgi:phenylalanyl-tRNA synthetase beta chain